MGDTLPWLLQFREGWQLQRTRLVCCTLCAVGQTQRLVAVATRLLLPLLTCVCAINIPWLRMMFLLLAYAARQVQVLLGLGLLLLWWWWQQRWG